MPHQIPEDGIMFQDETKMPFLQGTRAGVRAMNALWFFAQRKGRDIASLPTAKGIKENCAGEALENALASKGLRTPTTKYAKNISNVGLAVREVGFPAALKIVSPQASHKTEVGGVTLHLTSEAAATRAAEKMDKNLKSINPKAEIEGYLAQKMVTGLEFLVGAREDKLYGPILVVGAGGVLVEIVKDFNVRLLPVTQEDVSAMISELRCAPILKNFRGRGPSDIQALIKGIKALGDFYLEHRTWLTDIEINPLMVKPDSEGVCAVDIRAITR